MTPAAMRRAFRFALLAAAAIRARAAGRQAVDFGGACAADTAEVWALANLHADGSAALQLVYNRACFGAPNTPNA